ncbi:MAG TPA: metallophosphoesterase [Gemmatimonadales bacterium]|nr:metallophosphoesterase [Gemmatimonadales bacterium]
MSRIPLVSIALILDACAAIAPIQSAPAPVPFPGQVETTVFLIGDAGLPAPNGEPVLIALARALREAGGERVVVFLGDNIYPAGMPDSAARNRAEAERRLMAQVDVLRETGATGYFLPGNHDWAKLAPEGWDAVRRQQRFIEQQPYRGAMFVPPDGCPGPVAREAGSALLLVFLDTQWWLHQNAKPRHPTSSCPADSETEVADSLHAILGRAVGRHVIVAAHHPLRSAGPHGGYFPWTDHIFPLRHAADWLWVPVPLIGSVYPIVRMMGAIPQDLAHEHYAHMRLALSAALAPNRPLVYAAGHEHSLQVFGPDAATQFEVVSGGGYYGHTSPTTFREGMLFARTASGFMRLEAWKDGRVRLGVVTVDRAGNGTEEFSRWLK